MTYHEALAEHYHQIRTNPQYRLLEMMEDMRAEGLPAIWNVPEEMNTPLITETKPEPEWLKSQWEIVNQLRGMVKFLYLKETGRRANASKRRKDTI